LWLLYGNDYKPLSTEEREKYFPETTDFGYEKILEDNWTAHQEVVNLLRKCFTEKLDFSERKLQVRMLHGTTDTEFVEYDDRLANLEKGEGHRLFIGKYPSILLSKSPKQLAKLFVPDEINLQIKYEITLTSRIKQFEANVKVYGSRCIHSIESIKRFSENKDFDGLDVQERRGRIQRMITLLKHEPNFHVALADTEPEWEMMIKSFESVALRPTSRRISNINYPLIHGPKLIYWQNESLEYDDKTKKILNIEITDNSKKRRKKSGSDNLWNVIGSYLDFEAMWTALHNQGKTDRDYVKSELAKLI
jgi:hypothetical protein